MGFALAGQLVTAAVLPSPLRALAFDWGGVFTEGTFDSSAHARLAELHGLPAAEVRPHYLSIMAEFERGLFDMPEFHRRFQAAVGVRSDLSEFRATFLGAVRERAAMYDLLASLPEGVRVAVLSNNVPELCDVVRDDPRMARVETFVFSNEIHACKPAPEAYAALSAALDLPPESILFVDDNAANIAACEELGFVGLLLDDLPGFAARWRAALPGLPLPAAFPAA